MQVVIALLIAYLLGTIPTAVIVTRLFSRGRIDIRQAGSGNPGAMNTLSVLGTKAGLVVLIGDVGKAIVACVIARNIAGGNVADYAGSAAVIGHCFPVWTRFRGGKGVASSGGQCWATFPVYAPVAIAVAILTSRRRFESRAFVATIIAGSVWVGAASIWVAADLPNAWGPRPTAALVISALISGLMIVYKFTATTPTPLPPAPVTS